ncbi:hypothetical protein HYS72_02470 [Candidatus Pacearchaeota archaeon]|nr:hypothetical protein [Candidatus Pacearchaeota archaeon]MBI2056641.1 hypothetical protein [Candidatus Pacearchaeota archaeon]
MKKNLLILIIAAVIILAGIFFFPQNSKAGSFENIDAIPGEINIHKSLTCGCCSTYATYVSGKVSPKVNSMNVDDPNEIKERYGVPKEMESCHTTIIGNYFIEGHMPLEAVEKLLKEKPDIKGIALPGMPSGSPGMPGQKSGEFIIYAVNNDGTSSEFMKI